MEEEERRKGGQEDNHETKTSGHKDRTKKNTESEPVLYCQNNYNVYDVS